MIRPLACALALAALCGCGSAPPAGPAHVAVMRDTGLPAHIGGLVIAASDVSQTVMQSTDPHYVDAVALLTLSTTATPSQLVGTLEVAQYAPGTAIGSAAVRTALTAQLGAVEPYRLDVGGAVVDVTFARSTVVAAWFGRARMYILSLRSDFAGAKSLIRAATAVAT